MMIYRIKTRFPAKSTFSMLSLFNAILTDFIICKILRINSVLFQIGNKITLRSAKT